MARRVSSPVFIGREEELAALHAALDRASEGRTQGVLLAGESGVGKTRLLDEFRRRAGDTKARWLFGECIAVAEGALPYAPITAALRTAAQKPEVLDLTAESAPELAHLLHLSPDTAPNPAQSADEEPPPFMGEELAQSRLFEQFLSLLTDLSSESPAVLAVEDLHWADRSTRDLLSFLLRSRGENPFLVACSYRSDELHRQHPLRPFLAEQERLESVEHLELPAFTQSECVAQLEGILGDAPDSKLAMRLFERSEGNAFFAEELLAAAHDRAEGLPRSVRDALMLRVEALSAATQEVLRAAAAAGRRVSHALLVAVARLPEPQLTEALREAVAHQILVQDAEGESYSFRHALLAEAAYADLMPGERTRLHLALAEALDAEPGLAADPAGNPAAELAFHWRACHRLEDALATSVAAGLQAEKSYAWAEANQHFENVLELWDRVEDAERRAGMDHAAALLRAAQDASWSGQLRRAVTLARSAVAEIEADPVRESLARERFAEFLWLSGDSPAALEVLRGAINLLPSPSQERGRLLSAEGRLLMLHGRPEESRSRCEEAIAIARRIGDRAEEGRALNTLGCDDMFIGDRRKAEERLREAMRIASDFAPHDLWRAYGNLAEALDQDGRVEEGVEMGIEGAEVARGLGQRAWTTFLLGTVAERLVRLGRFEEAEGWARSGLEAFHEGIDVATLFCVLAEVALHRGEVEQAQAKLERALEAAGRTADLLTGGMITHAMARLAMARGENDQAAQLVEEAMEGLGSVEYVFYNGSGYALAVRAHAERAERARSLGDTIAAAEAEESGTTAMERFKRLLEPDKWVDSPPPESLAHFALATAELGRLKGNPSPGAWSEVAEKWEKLGFPVERAYARWRQAEAVLAGGGTKVEAAQALREAARLATDCGASLLGAEVDALARRARIRLGDGAESASSEAPSPDENRFGLTDRELEVLGLLVQGRTNREIGETLYISAKTASAHVSHILSKLDVRTRVEAATAAHRLGLLSPDRLESATPP